MPETHPVDLDRIRRAVREILLAVGEDPDREGLRDTPDRVARMYAEVFRGLHQDPRVHLQKLFTQKYDEMVLIKDIQFESFCEHHLLPFTGKAHVAYLPNGKVLGLSKVPRVIDVLSRRPQMQERLTEEVADLLMKELEPKGVAVVVEASHSCMTVAGRAQAGQHVRHQRHAGVVQGAAGDPLRGPVADLRREGLNGPMPIPMPIPMLSDFSVRLACGLAALLAGDPLAGRPAGLLPDALPGDPGPARAGRARPRAGRVDGACARAGDHGGRPGLLSPRSPGAWALPRVGVPLTALDRVR